MAEWPSASRQVGTVSPRPPSGWRRVPPRESSRDRPRGAGRATPRFLDGGGGLGALMRAKDWSATPLGPPEGWPRPVKTAVSLCLNSRFPILLWLGPELRIVYNDAYVPFLGPAKHPATLGAPGREAWGEIWPTIGPMLDEALAGRATWVEDFRMSIRPVIEGTIAKGALVHTDEYDVYGRLEDWGYGHKTVCRARGEYARDEDGDGFREVHVDTAEGLRSLLRSRLRPHRGISQEKLPAYLAFFRVVHDARRRGKALLTTLVGALVASSPDPSTPDPEKSL